jgi:hypothetical protein
VSSVQFLAGIMELPGLILIAAHSRNMSQPASIHIHDMNGIYWEYIVWDITVLCTMEYGWNIHEEWDIPSGKLTVCELET